MAAYNLSPLGNGTQYFDAAGRPLAGGFIKTYAAGTSTPATTYANNIGSIPNATTITLGADGRPPVMFWLPSGSAFKFVLLDAASVVLDTWDNLVGINDTGAGSSVTSEWVASGAVPTYSSPTIFTTPGNTVNTFQIGRRIQAQVTAGLVYGTITNSVFGAATTVTVVMDSGMALDNGLVIVNVGFLGGTHTSIPARADSTLVLPYQPLFAAYRTTNQTSGGIAIYDNIYNQTGTGYDYTSGIFTAPITGTYLFVESGTVANASGGPLYFGLSIAVNNVAKGFSISYIQTGTASEANCSVVCPMVVGQTAKVISSIGVFSATQYLLSAGGTDSPYSTFSGCLLF